jgi:hypothetical protein
MRKKYEDAVEAWTDEAPEFATQVQGGFVTPLQGGFETQITGRNQDPMWEFAVSILTSINSQLQF